jgi:hypothetical protein
MYRLGSFLNEKTVEYILVPQLVEILHTKFESVIPFYFWANREGGSRTNSMMMDNDYKLIVFYARRPKIYSSDDEFILVNINTLLFERSKYFEAYDIPLLAGVPLLSDFSKIRLKSKCEWFQIGTTGHDESLLLNTVSENKIDLPNIKKLDPHDIIGMIEQKSRRFEWPEIVSIIKNIQFSENYRWHFMGERYKPVYILLR